MSAAKQERVDALLAGQKAQWRVDYARVDEDEIVLDGTFTATELRLIADAMDVEVPSLNVAALVDAARGAIAPLTLAVVEGDPVAAQRLEHLVAALAPVGVTP